jgi:exonuclease SbcD
MSTFFSEPRLTPVGLADGLTLWGAAHRSPANTPGFLDNGFQVDRDGIHLALFHGSERAWFTEQETGKQPHAPFDASQIQSAGLHHALLDISTALRTMIGSLILVIPTLSPSARMANAVQS